MQTYTPLSALSNRVLRSFEILFEFESDDSDSIRFEIFESAAPAVVPQITLTVQQKSSTIAPLGAIVQYCLGNQENPHITVRH